MKNKVSQCVLISANLIFDSKFRLRFAIIYICFSTLCFSVNAIYTQEISEDSQKYYEQAQITTDVIEKVKLLKASLQLSPQLIFARLELAKTLIGQKQYNKAIIQLDSTLNYDRKNAFVWYYKGVAHINLSENNTALKCFNRAIQLKNDIFEFYIYRGMVYCEIGSFDKALQSIEYAHSIADSTQKVDQKTKAIFWMGRILYTQGDHTNATKFFRQALELQPEFYEANEYLYEIEKNELYLAAEMAFREKNWEQANTNYKKILNIDSTFKDVSSKIARVRTKLAVQALLDSADMAKLRDNYEKAKKFLIDAISMDPERKTEIQLLIDQINKNQQVSMVSSVDSSEVGEKPETADSLIPVNDPDLLKDSIIFKSEIKTIWQWFKLKWITFSSLILLIIAIILVLLKLKKKRMGAISDGPVPFPVAIKYNWLPELPRYSIKEELDRGSMGYVYKAYDLKLERYVALKLIRLETEMSKDEIEERINRFLREAKATANLNHPNIVNLYDYDEKDGILYMTMEFIEGDSLREMLKKYDRIEVEQALEIIRQICSALEYAHKKNIIHRDIKPSNIILNKDGRVKILDFGLAKLINLTKAESCTMTGMRVGSPSYMSPEQINSKVLDVRSDIFSMGIVFYEMLTGEHPFNKNEGESLSRLFYLILNEDPAKPSSIRKNIPSGFDKIIEKMLAKDPQERYQTVSEVIRALDTF